MFVIENGFTYIAFLMFLCGGLLALQKYAKWKIFNIVPPLVWIYLIGMACCTAGMFDSEGVSAAYGALKNNLLYAMIFVMLLRCDFRKIGKLGARLIAIFVGCSFTLAVGFIIFFPILKGAMGGGEKTWAATAALYASWVGGSGNMAAMQAHFGELLDEGAYACALALDTVCYSVWIALLLLAVKYAPKWNNATNADTSKLDAVAAAANAEVAKEQKRATSADWVFLIGIALIASVVCQWLGGKTEAFLETTFIGNLFGKATCVTVIVTILGLICAMTPMGRLPAVEELSSVLLYAVVAMLASQAPLNALLDAPMWVVYGFLILVIHVVLMFVLSKLFRWDLCMVSTASVANIGGSASAPIIASAYDSSFAGIGVIMGVLGAAIGNFCGIGMGFILKLLA